MNYKKILIGAALAVAAVTTCGFGADKNYQLVEDTYTVKEGDKLWAISRRYMERNTYGSRDIREFMSGIVELNYDTVFQGRQPGAIYPGDELRINYWVAKD